MQMTPFRSAVMILAVAAGVMVTRFLPFVIFSSKRKMPKRLENLRELIPPAMMGLLVVYCFKDVSFTTPPFGIAEIVSVAVVAALHLWKRNSLLSVFGGVGVYMIFMQVIF